MKQDIERIEREAKKEFRKAESWFLWKVQEIISQGGNGHIILTFNLNDGWIVFKRRGCEVTEK